MHFWLRMVKKVLLFNHFIIILFKFTTQKREKFQGENANPLTEELGSDMHWPLFFHFLVVCCFLLFAESHKTSWKFVNWGKNCKTFFPPAGFDPRSTDWESGVLPIRPRKLRYDKSMIEEKSCFSFLVFKGFIVIKIPLCPVDLYLISEKSIWKNQVWRLDF